LCFGREKANDASHGPKSEKENAPSRACYCPKPRTVERKKQSSNTKRHKKPAANQKMKAG